MKIKLIQKQYIWIYLAVITIILRIILGFFPNIIERFYSRGIFLGIRWTIDNTTARLPFPMFYVLIFVFIITMFLAFRQWFFLWKKETLTIIKILLSIGNFLGFIIFFFLISWGFNYGREPLENQLKLNTETLNLQQIIIETEEATIEINEARKRIPNSDTFALNTQFLPNNLVDTMRQLLVKVLILFIFIALDLTIQSYSPPLLRHYLILQSKINIKFLIMNCGIIIFSSEAFIFTKMLYSNRGEYMHSYI